MYEIVRNPKVTSRYGGNRNISSIGVSGFHNGIDIVSSTNDDDLLAIADGKIIHITENDGTGCKTVVTAHGGILPYGMVLLVLYAHCDKFYVKNGQVIKKSEKVAKMGSSGRVTGKHLHVSMYVLPQYVWKDKKGKYFTWNYKEREKYEINPNDILKLY